MKFLIQIILVLTIITGITAKKIINEKKTVINTVKKEDIINKKFGATTIVLPQTTFLTGITTSTTAVVPDNATTVTIDIDRSIPFGTADSLAFMVYIDISYDGGNSWELYTGIGDNGGVKGTKYGPPVTRLGPYNLKPIAGKRVRARVDAKVDIQTTVTITLT